MCLRIETPQNIDFPFFSKMEDKWFLDVPIFEQIEPNPNCLRIGTPQSIDFLFVQNGRVMVFRCPDI